MKLAAAALALTLFACQPAPPAATDAAPKSITLADYEAIAPGQTLESVQHILGQDGEVFSQAAENNAVWAFQNPEDIGGVLLVTIINGEVVVKSQSGLPEE
jgi:hypothetical protein